MASSDSGGFFSYNSQLDAFTLYHLVQEDTTSPRKYNGPALPALGHATAGAVASAFAKAIVYPIDTIVTRMQVQKGLKGEKEAQSAASGADLEYNDVLDAARKIYRNEGGLGAFYTGLGSDVVKHIADSFLFFLAYTALRERMLKSQGGKQLTVLRELSIGVVAGAFSKAITSPIQNIVTRQQTAALLAARNPTSSTTPAESDKLSVKDIALQIQSEKGLAGFWTGYSAQLVLTLNPAITFAVDNLLRNLVPKKYKESPSLAQTFLIAALSKVAATSVTYPVTLAKSRAMASQSSSSRASHPRTRKPTTAPEHLRQTLLKLLRIFDGQAALIRSLRAIYRHEGVGGLYSGIEGEVVKGFLQHGLTMVAKDNVHGGIVQLYYILLKLTRRWPEEIGQTTGAAVDAVKEVGAKAQEVGRRAEEVVRKATGQED